MGGWRDLLSIALALGMPGLVMGVEEGVVDSAAAAVDMVRLSSILVVER